MKTYQNDKNSWDDPFSWDNKFFGGSVLDPIKRFNQTWGSQHERIEVRNYLLDDLDELMVCEECVTPLYFEFQNLFVKERNDHALFADVSSLITPELSFPKM